jgi:hypothetical protein
VRHRRCVHLRGNHCVDLSAFARRGNVTNSELDVYMKTETATMARYKTGGDGCCEVLWPVDGIQRFAEFSKVGLR